MGASTTQGVPQAQSAGSQALYGTATNGAMTGTNGNTTISNKDGSTTGPQSFTGPSLTNVNQNLANNYGAAGLEQQLNNTTQAQLTNATNQGIQQSAGLVASQKGINPALAARMAGQNAAQSTQQAANQSAALQGQNAIGANQLSLQAQNQLSSNLNNQYNTSQGVLSGSNSANASSNAAMTNAVVGGIGGAVSGGATALAKGFADGGEVTPSATGPKSRVAQALSGAAKGMTPFAAGSALGSSIVGAAMAKGGKVGEPVKAMVSPGERYLNPREAKAAKEGKIDASKAGKEIPGKASVKGDSLKNDVVPATLESGGIVIPRSVMESSNPQREAAKFVKVHMMHTKLMKKHGSK